LRATAAIVNEQDGPFRIEEVDIDEPGKRGVLVQIVATGICHTDGLASHGDLPFRLLGSSDEFVKERGRQVSVADPTRGASLRLAGRVLTPPRVLGERRLVSWIVTATPRDVRAMPGLVTGLAGRCRTAHRVCRVSPRASHEARCRP
jgi:hypothetical protein